MLFSERIKKNPTVKTESDGRDDVDSYSAAIFDAWIRDLFRTPPSLGPHVTLWSLWLAVSARGEEEGLGQSIRAVQKIWPIRVQLFLDDLVELVCHLPGGTCEWREGAIMSETA